MIRYNWDMFRRNPDADLRSLERRAYTGDRVAGEKLILARKCTGQLIAKRGEIVYAEPPANTGVAPFLLVIGANDSPSQLYTGEMWGFYPATNTYGSRLIGTRTGWEATANIKAIIGFTSSLPRRINEEINIDLPDDWKNFRSAFRANPDEDLRSLERRSNNSEEDFLRYASALARTGPLPATMWQPLRQIFLNDYRQDRPRSKPFSDVIPIIMGMQSTDIFLNTVLDSHDRPHQLYIVLQAMLQDLPVNATILEVAGWMWDRRQHRRVPGSIDPRFNNVVDNRFPFSIDLTDLSSDVHFSGVFPSVSRLETWTQLSAITEHGRRDPRLYGSSQRPTPEQAVGYALKYLHRVIGVQPKYELQAHHGPEISDTKFEIWILSTQAGSMPIGEVTYQITDDGSFEFVAITFDF